MASTLDDDNDVYCVVCQDVLRNPVALSCNHVFCEVCVQKFWKSKRCRECPLCRGRSSRERPPLPLPNPISGELCRRNSEELKLFCVKDDQPVCLVYRPSREHTSHTLQAAAALKEEMKIILECIKEKVKIYEEEKATRDQTAEDVKTQARHTEKQIHEEFEKLHQFLRDEEAARIAALREEEEQNSQMMKEKIEDMSRVISYRSGTIRAIEEKMSTDDINVLQNYKSVLERAQCTLQDPERVSGPVINVAKHLDNLKFSVWMKMRKIVQCTPVTLDPTSAHPDLLLSEDLTSVRYMSQNIFRFDKFHSVVGSEGFNTGTHCWDVEVGECPRWTVGVMMSFAQKWGDYVTLNGRLFMWYKDGQYGAGHSGTPTPSTLLTVQQKLQRIRVQLDCDKEELSFHDLDNNTHLHTLSGLCAPHHHFCRSSEKAFPYFNLGCVNSSLRILPASPQ
ncbi:E3 ubiquitin-protein ligase TRIM35-like isoform X1 [Sardina pilchardus]|uniref:E3 ubiquitin-protein ligase TRIM35-like isoform X1 n=1 Tax=Sardina pilchardus TaxID=27697 RepID=UPI002E102EAB